MDVVADSSTRLNFVFRKIVDSNVADVSDAGMVYYVLTGDERGPRQAPFIPEWESPRNGPP
jgi:hypothetical protein